MHVCRIVVERFFGNLALRARDDRDAADLYLSPCPWIAQEEAGVCAAHDPLGHDLVVVGETMGHLDRRVAHACHLRELALRDRLFADDGLGEERVLDHGMIGIVVHNRLQLVHMAPVQCPGIRSPRSGRPRHRRTARRADTTWLLRRVRLPLHMCRMEVLILVCTA